MKLELFRQEVSKDGKATIGQLHINGKYECWTLEDIPRKVKIKKETAIPAGTYRVVIDFSPKYKKNMPHVLDVPGFVGIRIHSGNNDEHTEGCILLGRTHSAGTNFIGESRLAFQAFNEKLKAAIEAGELCELTIYDIQPTKLPVEGTDI